MKDFLRCKLTFHETIQLSANLAYSFSFHCSWTCPTFPGLFPNGPVWNYNYYSAIKDTKNWCFELHASAFMYIWFFLLLLFLFRPFQLTGIKRKLFLVCLIKYSLDTIYRVALQMLGITHCYICYPLRITLTALFFSNQCLQIYILTKYLCSSSQKKMALFFKMIVPSYFGFLAANLCINLIVYPAYMKKMKMGNF